MREIKFRAWDNFNKRMLGPFGPFRWHDEYDLLYLEGTLDVPAGDNLNFMQFTGLKDKNGKEIYEGDILYVPAFGNHEMKWDDGQYVCYVRGVNQAMAGQCEVIGNIYENPDKLDPSNPSFN
jgi:uncharacterized phage protein (TIGR01671 family)